MKLQDPGLEALLEAYRADRRPTDAMREQMWQRFDAARRPRPAWVRAAVATAVAVAALVLLWLAIRGFSGEVARARGPASGTQAPLQHEAEPPRGTASTMGGRATGSGAAAPADTTVESLPSVTPPGEQGASEERARQAHASEPASGPRDGERSTVVPPEPAPKVPSDDLALVEAAEAALRADDPERALELLHRHEQRFPRAPTVEEREALRVLALCAAGRAVEGRGARWTFLREHPRSAYRERIEKACPPA